MAVPASCTCFFASKLARKGLPLPAPPLLRSLQIAVTGALTVRLPIGTNALKGAR